MKYEIFKTHSLLHDDANWNSSIKYFDSEHDAIEYLYKEGFTKDSSNTFHLCGYGIQTIAVVKLKGEN